MMRLAVAWIQVSPILEFLWLSLCLFLILSLRGIHAKTVSWKSTATHEKQVTAEYPLKVSKQNGIKREGEAARINRRHQVYVECRYKAA